MKFIAFLIIIFTLSLYATKASTKATTKQVIKESTKESTKESKIESKTEDKENKENGQIIKKDNTLENIAEDTENLTEKEKELIYRYSFNKGNRYFKLKDYKKALFFYDIAFSSIKKENIDTSIFYKTGYSAFEQGQLEKAITYFKLVPIFKSKGKKKLEFKTYYGLGRAYKQNREYTKALIYLNKAFDIDKDNEELLILISKVYVSLKRYKKAVSLLESAKLKEKNSLSLLFALANTHYKKQDITKAIIYYEKALEQDKNNQAVLIKLGKVFLTKQMFPKALVYLEKAYKQGTKKDKELLIDLSFALVESKKYARAIRLINDKMSKDEIKKDANFAFLLGLAYYKSEQYLYAIEYFESLVQTRQKHIAGILPLVAYSYFEIKDYHNAIFYYRWAISYNPLSIELKEKLALSYFKNRSFHLASLEFLKLITRGNKEPKTFLRLAQSYIGQRDYKKAKKVLRHIRVRFLDYEKTKVQRYLKELGDKPIKAKDSSTKLIKDKHKRQE